MLILSLECVTIALFLNAKSSSVSEKLKAKSKIIVACEIKLENRECDSNLVGNIFCMRDRTCDK